VPEAFDFVGQNLDMERLHMPNTRHHHFVGVVLIIWLCSAYQFAGCAEALLGAHVWPCWLVWHTIT